MSYQVLARKWRPRKFSEMAGQEHVLQALINALDNDRLHHAYLFTGTRGVGKTTIARILAKCLNCEQGVSSVPCGECGACTGIAEGRFVDLIEADAASRTKVEDTRELLENVQYAPTAGRYKVYLIDEVHMLSTHSFNALLKTLEEPPPHVKFLLATTEPQKLPVTVLSRCLQFNLKNLSPERIVEHLQFVLGEENVPFEETSLWSLARAADGSMRDALSLTDQAIAHGGGKLTENEVGAMLGTIDLSTVIDICRALANNDGDQALALVDKMAEHAPDYSAALAELLSVWHRVAIAQIVPEALDNRHGDHQAITELANQLPREDVQLFYQTALLARRDLPLAPDGKVGFEMALLRMLAFQPVAESRIEPPVTAPVPAVEEAAPQEAVASVKKSETEASSEELVPNDIEADIPTPEETTIESLLDERVDESVGEQIVDSTSEQAYFESKSISEAPSVPAPESIEEPLPAIEPVARKVAEPVTENSPTPVSTEQLRQFSHQAHEHEASKTEPVAIDNGAEEIVEAAPAADQPAIKLALAQLSPTDWISVYKGLAVGGVIQNIAANLVLIERDGHRLRFELDMDNSSLYEDSHSVRIEQALTDYFGESVSIDIEVGQVSSETPQANMLRLRAERQAAAVESMKNDTNVQQLVSRFDGRLLENTVKPLD